MLLLLGLKDDYSHDGRALVEALDNSALPRTIHDGGSTFTGLAQAYEQVTPRWGSSASAR
jgi:hypothetical protein